MITMTLIYFSGGPVQQDVFEDEGYMTPVPLSGNYSYNFHNIRVFYLTIRKYVLLGEFKMWETTWKLFGGSPILIKWNTLL